MWLSKIMTDHSWVPGIICLAAGVAISIWGIFFSRYIIAVVGGFLVFIVMGMFMVLYHTPDTNVGRFLLGFTISVAFGFFLKTRDTLGIFFISIVGGLFAGLYVSEIISGITGWSSFYMMSYVCGVFMVAGLDAGLACKDCCEVGKYTFIWILAHCKDGTCPARMHARTFRLMMTSFLGSYLFMRGWAFIIGGFPTEKEVFN
jgi:hypothetical protein